MMEARSLQGWEESEKFKCDQNLKLGSKQKD